MENFSFDDFCNDSYKTELVKLLVNSGANVNYVSKNEDSPFIAAIVTENYELMKYLYNKGANIDVRNNGNTGLHFAVELQNLPMIKFLIEKGINVNATNKFKMTPLHKALNENTGKPVIELLIKSGADLQAKNVNGDTPLHIALKNGYDLDVIDLLVKKGSNIHTRGDLLMTPLMIAIQNNADIEIIEYFIRKGADVNLLDVYNDTALNLAIIYTDSVELVNLLIENGAKMHLRNDSNANSLMLSLYTMKNSGFILNLFKEYISHNEIGKYDYLSLLFNTLNNPLNSQLIAGVFICRAPNTKGLTASNWKYAIIKNLIAHKLKDFRNDLFEKDIKEKGLMEFIPMNYSTCIGYYIDDIINNSRINFESEEGNNFLHLLVYRKKNYLDYLSNESAQKLAKKKNKDGWTPLFQATFDNDFIQCDRLTKIKSFDPNDEVDYFGNSIDFYRKKFSFKEAKNFGFNEIMNGSSFIWDS